MDPFEDCVCEFQEKSEGSSRGEEKFETQSINIMAFRIRIISRENSVLLDVAVFTLSEF